MSVDIRDIIVVKKDVKGANYGFINIKTGKFYGFYHTNEFKTLTEEEV